MKKKSLLSFLALSFLLSTPLRAEDSPEAIFQKFVEACRKGDVEEVIRLSSAAKRKEAEESLKKEMPRAQTAEFMKATAPENYKILSQTLSKDQKKISLFVEALMQDIFALKGEKPKKTMEKGEIQLVKEDGVWKMDQECWGSEGRCEKVEKGTPISFGKKAPLKEGAWFWAEKGQASSFPTVKTQNQPYVVNLVFQGSDKNPMLNYLLHASPHFADFYLKVGDQKITPIAFIEDNQVKVMEPSTSYSRSKTINKKWIVSLLFDIPKEAKGAKSIWANFSMGDAKYSFQVSD